MLLKTTAAPLALLLAAASAPAFAQSHDAATTLPSVEIVGRPTARQIAVEEATVRLNQRAGAVDVIAASEFDRGRATTLGDILTYAPGVVAQTRHGEEVRFSIRGSGIQRGFLMRGVQLYQDGVPMNLADGGGDYQSIDPLAIQHIEVWRGANALEYGSSTLGGAINFVTPTGRTADLARLRFDVGSFGQQRAHLMVGAADATTDGLLSVTRSEQDGWRDHSATEATRITANLGRRFNDTLEGRLLLTRVDSELELPGSISRAALDADRRQAAPNSDRLNAGNNYVLTRAAARLTWAPSEGRSITASAYVSDRDRFHPMTFGILDQQSQDLGLDVRGVFDLGSGGLTRRLVVGASTARYEGTENRFTNPNGSPGVRTGLNDVEADLQTVYAEYSHGLTTDLTVQLGAQATRATRKLDNRTTPSGSYDETFEAFSPKLGLLWQATSADQVFANVSRSFEPAPFGEAPVRPLLPLPDAQEATTLELGWRRQAGPVQLEATAYRAWIDRELLALTDATGTSIGTANADRTIHQGVELGARLPLTETVSLRGAYVLNDFRFDGDAQYGDRRIAGLPEHLLHAEVEWRIAPWLSVAPSVEWQSDVWIDHANTVKSSGFALAHLRLGGDVTPRVRWSADVRNLFDREYIAGTAVQANVRGADGAYYFPGDPRSVYVGLEWRY
ncbi:TonB-dependent receptor family protein [Brevundimonas staleyi]|uniref:TonB-dependent receptor family protein n=1 Tax=Brevundimonas staleyi TaxID=74326 RepID=A0ABW0FWM0_9CAUL